MRKGGVNLVLFEGAHLLIAELWFRILYFSL